MRSEFKFFATVESSTDGHWVKKCESDSVIEGKESSVSRPFSARCGTSFDEAPYERAAAVKAQRSQTQSVCGAFLRRMRSLTKDGHAGIDVRVTSTCTVDIIRAT